MITGSTISITGSAAELPVAMASQTDASKRTPTRIPKLVPALRTFGFFLYYLVVIILILWVYGRGDTPTAPFVYQGF
jgi:hypothetical protein